MKTLLIKDTNLSVFLIKDDSEHSFDDINKKLYLTNITADGQGNYVDVEFTSIDVELVTDIIPPIDWLPNKYNYIDNEWVLDNKLNIAAVAI
jgi:hypothetical protein